jgi:hypothetical protein
MTKTQLAAWAIGGFVVMLAMTALLIGLDPLNGQTSSDWAFDHRLELMFWGAIAVALMIYFLPTYIAVQRDQPNALAIFALNLFLGWSLIGWVGSLVWALVNQRRSGPL